MWLGVLALAAGAAAAHPAATPAAATITIAVPRSDAAVPFELAAKHGLFASNGVQVQLMLVASTSQALAAVAGGKAQFGVGDPSSVMVYDVDKPASLQLVSGVTTTRRGFTGLLTATAGIRSAAGIYGKRVGVPELDGLDRLAAQVWLDENGADTNTVTFVQVASSNARRALAKRYVDAVLVEQPELATLSAVPGIRSLGDIENGLLGSEAAATAVFSTSGFLQSTPGHTEAAGLVGALRAAVSYAATHRAESISILSADAGWTHAATATMTPLYSVTLSTFILEQIAESQYAYQIASGQPNVAALVWAGAPQSS
ncbi:MAG TPA: ABC transporter substrate-binding protein [Gaiellaceae bacterium]|nr:ABC transporter substrate-binding protein [Gaiellaceae bacterium]